MEKYYATDRIDRAVPIPDALDGVKRLKEMGFKLVVVTARTMAQRERSLIWVENHFPGGYVLVTQNCIVSMRYHLGVFETVVCTGQSQETTFADGHELITKLDKAAVRIQWESRMDVSNGIIIRSAGKSTQRS